MAATAAGVMTPPTTASAPTQDFAKGWSQPSPAGAAAGGPALVPGAVLGTRYEILQLLGQGGMGAVYKARDIELDRVVALKVIRPEVAYHPDMLQRFKQELLLARQITHRNVIRIFDLGEAGGVKFITMEFIAGQDLRSLIIEKGRLSPEESVAIIEQVCLALEAAHAEGVVHRDLKPQNIMIDSHGRAAVMDFGIARSVESGGMTQTGMLVGTPDYMSPEQVMGEHVDVRSDLFTLGVILYELLTGAMPYKSDTVQASMFRRTRELPKPPIEIDPVVPKALSDIAARCLQIDPALRYQSAREILNDLQAWRGGGVLDSATVARAKERAGFSALQSKWIPVTAAVVLAVVVAGWLLRNRLFPSQPASPASAVALAIVPFRNASGDPSLDWLGSSVAETLSTDVGQSAHLRVVSSERVNEIFRDLRLSSDTSFDPPTIERLAEFSNADDLVWGRYARFGDQIRLDATVQDVKHGRTTAITESATEGNILSAIDRLAADIRSSLALSTSVVKELQGQSFKATTTSADALRDYNEGLQLARRGNDLEAVQRFQAATKADPSFALAYSELGRSYAQLGQDDDAEQASRKAVELSDQLPAAEKYLIQASHYSIRRDYPKAIEAYENLAKVSPDDADVLFNLGVLYEISGQYDTARAELARVLSLDPKRVAGLLEMGRVEIRAGNPQKGLEHLTQAQAMAIESGNDEERSDILQAMGGAYRALDKNEDAIRNFEDALDIRRKLGLRKGIADSLEDMASAQAQLGQSAVALKNYNDALAVRREIGDKAGTADALNDLGQFYDDHGQYAQALPLFKESLQTEIDVGNLSNQGLVLNNIGNTYLFNADYQNARTYFEQALQVREKLGVSGDIADTLHNLAETLNNMAQYDQALQDYLRALDLRRKAGDKRGAAIESSGMGNLFGYQGRYGAAVSSEEDAVKTMRDIQEQGFWLAEVLGAYGLSLAEVGRSDDAKKNLDEAMTVARSQKDEAIVAELLGYEGDDAFYRGDYASSASLFAQAVQTAAHTTDAHLILVSKVSAAKAEVKLGHFASASNTLRSLAQQADTMGLKYLSVECAIYQGEAALGMKNYALAKAQLQSAASRSESLGMQGFQAQSQFLLARVFDLTGNKDEAQDHYKQARQVADAIQKDAHTDTITKRSDLSSIFSHAS